MGPRSIILPALLWLAMIVCMIALVALSGCSTVEGMCGVQPAGQDENGVAYFRYHCEPS